jgi:polysaccharide biosynthesis/export protein
MQNNLKSFTPYLVFAVISLLAFSCVPYNKIRYFTDIDEITEPIANPQEQKLITAFDNLYIRVLSIDEQTNTIFNANEGNTGMQFMISYLVDENGNINFPFVGNINVGGLTITQASTKIQTALSEYVPKTSVIVRYVENKVTVMGQVERQGVYSFTQDKLNIYEALSLGGGITKFGNRKNVVLMRHEGNKIVHLKVNLSDSRIASKDYFYILPNDILVVEPMRSISWSYNNSTFTTILTTITSILALYIVFFPNR